MAGTTAADREKERKEERVSRINFRVTRDEEELIRAGAAVRGVTVTAYLLQIARKQAEEDLADRRFFLISREKMNAFHAALERPVQEKARLRRLFSEPSLLEGEIDDKHKGTHRPPALSGREA